MAKLTALKALSKMRKSPSPRTCKTSPWCSAASALKSAMTGLDGEPGPHLVVAHQARIIGDVGEQYRAKPALQIGVLVVGHRLGSISSAMHCLRIHTPT